jgi:Zn-dependent peptidase ImmA (M78 family)
MAGQATKAAITKAHRVRGEYGLDLEGPVPDLLDLAERHCGVPVVIAETLPGDLAGAYLPRNGVPVILLNGADSASRLRFTLAHELGHHVFHDDRSEDTHAGIVTSGHWIEVRANAFAAELLVPAPAVVAWMAGRAASIDTAVELANAFGTSTVASAIRLHTAGLATRTEVRALRAEIEADDGLLYKQLDYEDSISAARCHLPRTPNANSVLAMRLPAERVARQLGRQTTEVASALALVAPGEEKVV